VQCRPVSSVVPGYGTCDSSGKSTLAEMKRDSDSLPSGYCSSVTRMSPGNAGWLGNAMNHLRVHLWTYLQPNVPMQRTLSLETKGAACKRLMHSWHAV